MKTKPKGILPFKKSGTKIQKSEIKKSIYLGTQD